MIFEEIERKNIKTSATSMMIDTDKPIGYFGIVILKESILVYKNTRKQY